MHFYADELLPVNFVQNNTWGLKLHNLYSGYNYILQSSQILM